MAVNFPEISLPQPMHILYDKDYKVMEQNSPHKVTATNKRKTGKNRGVAKDRTHRAQ
jgi:hypothetical protein